MEYGKRLWTKFAVLVVVWAGCVPLSAYGQDANGNASPDEGRRRGFLFELGTGFAAPDYGYEFESFMAELDAEPGVDRVRLALNLGLGWAVSQNTYLLGRVHAIGDRVSDGYDYLQMNLYLYSLAIRIYPFTTGLFIGGGAGMARAVAMTSGMGSLAGEPGYGAALGFGYDLGGKTGFGLFFALDLLYLEMDGDPVTGLQATVNLGWK